AVLGDGQGDALRGVHQVDAVAGVVDARLHTGLRTVDRVEQIFDSDGGGEADVGGGLAVGEDEAAGVDAEAALEIGECGEVGDLGADVCAIDGGSCAKGRGLKDAEVGCGAAAAHFVYGDVVGGGGGED